MSRGVSVVSLAVLAGLAAARKWSRQHEARQAHTLTRTALANLLLSIGVIRGVISLHLRPSTKGFRSKGATEQ